MKNAALTLVAMLTLGTSQAWAIEYNGVEFAAGDVSFADSVIVDFAGAPAATNGKYSDPALMLGAPDHGGQRLATRSAHSYSMGRGGIVTLQFTDNSLTGSGDDAADLAIFERGPDVEGVSVEISKDGVTWFNVGSTDGGVDLIDIDAFGFDLDDLFSYVRLTDLYDQGRRRNGDNRSVGADIDAVGAISSGPVASTEHMPEPATMTLLALGAATMARRRKRERETEAA